MTTGRLDGKRALVTAAAAGIGRACAIAFAREGARVLATDIDEKGLATLSDAGIGETRRLDVRDRAAIADLANSVGVVDILLNAAGLVHQGTILEASDADWGLSFDLNVRSMHRMMQALLPAMIEAGKGSIVNIGSASGPVKASQSRYLYSATKAAVAAMTRSVAADFVKQGIRCNCICPSTIDTPSLRERVAAGGPGARAMFEARQPIGRFGTVDEVAHLAVYLASDESAFTTGVLHVIDGGWTL